MATPPPSAPPQDPARLAAEAQIEILRQAATFDAEIKRNKARADIAIAAFKARQWAEIEHFQAGLKAELRRLEIIVEGHSEQSQQPSSRLQLCCG